MFRCNHPHQGAYYLSLLNNSLVRQLVNKNVDSIKMHHCENYQSPTGKTMYQL
jgi:hypothetical protein